MKAGPELDALVAEKVMGLRPGVDFGAWAEHEWKRTEDGEIDDFGMDADTHNGPSCTRCWYGYCGHCQKGPTEPCEVEPDEYSTRIVYAWRVVEKLWPEFSWTITDDEPPHVLARFWQGDHHWESVGESAPHAICLAALGAVEWLSGLRTSGTGKEE